LVDEGVDGAVGGGELVDDLRRGHKYFPSVVDVGLIV
jgi:hypothetical protein